MSRWLVLRLHWQSRETEWKGIGSVIVFVVGQGEIIVRAGQGLVSVDSSTDRGMVIESPLPAEGSLYTV